MITGLITALFLFGAALAEAPRATTPLQMASMPCSSIDEDCVRSL